jgi:hypothetical protein
LTPVSARWRSYFGDQEYVDPVILKLAFFCCVPDERDGDVQCSSAGVEEDEFPGQHINLGTIPGVNRERFERLLCEDLPDSVRAHTNLSLPP